MNFVQLQDRVKFVLNFTDGQVNADFTDTRIKQAINFAYQKEVSRGKQEGQKSFFKKYQDMTWPSATVEFTLPKALWGKQIYHVEDITENNPGEPILRYVHAVTNHSWQWGMSGPGSDRTLRVYYLAEAIDMEEDDDMPELIPDHMHELLVWSAAIFLRQVADEEAPREWHMERESLRMDYAKWLSSTKPVADEPPNVVVNDIVVVGDQAPQDGSSIG